MRYMLLIYQKEGIEGEMTPEELKELGRDYGAFTRMLADSGKLVLTNALHPVGMATTIRLRGGKVMATDGPFAETKEQLAGFYIIRCADASEAARTATQLPAARFGSIEIRPVVDLT